MITSANRLVSEKIGSTTYKLKPLTVIEKAEAMQALAQKGIREIPRVQMLSALRRALVKHYSADEIGKHLEAIDRSKGIRDEGDDNEEAVREIMADNELIVDAEYMASVDDAYNALRGKKMLYYPYLQWYIVKYSLKKVGSKDVANEDGIVDDETLSSISTPHLEQLATRSFELLTLGEEERKNSK